VAVNSRKRKVSELVWNSRCGLRFDRDFGHQRRTILPRNQRERIIVVFLVIFLIVLVAFVVWLFVSAHVL
jgi:hypothetical protein